MQYIKKYILDREATFLKPNSFGKDDLTKQSGVVTMIEGIVITLSIIVIVKHQVKDRKLKAKIDEINNNPNLSEEEKNKEIHNLVKDHYSAK